MFLAAQIVAGFVAFLHFYFLYLEMFQWTSPRGLKAFGQTLEFAKASKVLAANQGLYNGFLASGLVWGIFEPNPSFAVKVMVFFLGCVFIAGLYGAWTVTKKILYIQAAPALLGLFLILISGLKS